MKNLKRSILAMLLVVVLVASSVVPVSAAGTQPSKYSTTNNSGTRHVVCTTLDGTSAASYYTGSYTYDRLEDLSGSVLTTTLRTLMTSTHKYKSSYANCRDYANRTDCENGSGSNIITIYTSYSTSQSEYNGGNGWNREHVWPKSLGGFNQDGAGADLHHIRPSENKTNSQRGNKLYGNVSSGSKSTGNLSGIVGGEYSGNYYEPLDEVKGDVARICLYVYVRYGTEYSQCSKITNVFQSIDVLLEWCALDPVDTWEMGRNEVVGSIQGNRNVFIDYPELAWLIFDREVPSNMQTPSGEANGNTSGGNQGGTVSCNHAATEIKNNKEATCTENGYSGDVYCKSCGVKLSAGTTVSAKGHTWSGWVLNDLGNKKTRSCTACGITESEKVEILDCSHDNIIYVNRLLPTCGVNGYTGDAVCERCELVIEKGEIVPAHGAHKWGDIVITVEPTEDVIGSGTKTCNGCGRVQNVVISNYTAEEEMVAAISWNIAYALLNSYLTKV